MDLLYVVGTGSKYNNDELKYSLRSVEKNCTGYDRIFIVGYKPDFLNDNVIHIPCNDRSDVYKHWNMLNKIKVSVDTTDISDNFVLQSDDHFYCKPYDFNKIQIYHRSEIIREVPKLCSNPRFKTAMVETRKLLEKHNLPTIQTSAHCGTWFNKTIFKSIEDTLIKEALENYWGCEPTCLVEAVMQKELGIKPVPRKDVKINKDASIEAALLRIGDNFCFSVNDRGFQLMLPYLQQKFPNKSKYEK